MQCYLSTQTAKCFLMPTFVFAPQLTSPPYFNSSISYRLQYSEVHAVFLCVFFFKTTFISEKKKKKKQNLQYLLAKITALFCAGQTAACILVFQFPSIRALSQASSFSVQLPREQQSPDYLIHPPSIWWKHMRN